MGIVKKENVYMQRIRQLGLLFAALLSICVIAAMPVAADQGSDSGGSGSGDGSSTTSGDSSGGSSSASGETGGSNDGQTSSEVETQVGTLQKEAKDLLTNDRKGHQTQSIANRQKACEARAANINKRVSDYSAAAQRHLDTFTSILTRLQTFYTSKNLNVSTYASLLAAAQAKQSAAQTAVDALKMLDTNINCSQSDPAQTVAAMKQAVDNARTALQAYRTAIKDLIIALQGASTDQTNQSATGGNQ
jgi:chromosome segregation ATPase